MDNKIVKVTTVFCQESTKDLLKKDMAFKIANVLQESDDMGGTVIAIKEGRDPVSYTAIFIPLSKQT